MNSHDLTGWSTDKLFETLHWIKDRRDYCRACDKRTPNDYTLEDAVYREIRTRKELTQWFITK